MTDARDAQNENRDEELEFTDQQTDQIDAIHNGVFDLVRTMTGLPNLEWDMEYIGEIADAVASALLALGFRVNYPAIQDGPDGEHIADWEEPSEPRDWPCEAD